MIDYNLCISTEYYHTNEPFFNIFIKVRGRIHSEIRFCIVLNFGLKICLSHKNLLLDLIGAHVSDITIPILQKYVSIMIIK